jgi:ubiquinone/menaquinone biosynthesis C-methylase UbiE
VAGGGTGDGAIQLAQHLAWRGNGGEVVYLDRSSAARRVAEARARARGLANLSFHTGSLLDVAGLGLGPFDYIDCCGVLHHLADPLAGLRALVSVLAPGGGLGLMLYGALGRTGVYPLQRALRRLVSDQPVPRQVALARHLLAALPESNWFRRNPHLGDHLSGDAGLYDLLLNPRDRAYTVDEVVELMAAAGLRISGFLPPLRYEPALLLPAGELAERAAALSPLQQAALAEELAGSQKTHVFYAVAADNPTPPARPTSPRQVSALREQEAGRLAAAIARAGTLQADLDGRRITLKLPAGAASLVSSIDGRRSLEAIRQSLSPAPAWAEFLARFQALYRPLNGLNLLLLGGPGAPPR